MKTITIIDTTTWFNESEISIEDPPDSHVLKFKITGMEFKGWKLFLHFYRGIKINKWNMIMADFIRQEDIHIQTYDNKTNRVKSAYVDLNNNGVSDWCILFHE